MVYRVRIIAVTTSSSKLYFLPDIVAKTEFSSLSVCILITITKCSKVSLELCTVDFKTEYSREALQQPNTVKFFLSGLRLVYKIDAPQSDIGLTVCNRLIKVISQTVTSGYFAISNTPTSNAGFGITS